MPEDDATHPLKFDPVIQKLCELSLAQTRAIMELSHAIQIDNNISEDARASAKKAWAQVDTMMDLLNDIARITNGFPTDKEVSDE